MTGRPIIAIAGGVLVAAAALMWPVQYGPTRASAWFTAYAAALGIAALAVAGVAAVYARPTYLDWSAAQRRKPAMSLGFEVRNSTQEEIPEPFMRAPVGTRVAVDLQRFLVRVVISNSGTGPLDGALNIVVPIECRIEVMGNAPHHRVIGYPSENDDLVPGKTSLMRWTVMERRFPAHTEIVAHVAVQARALGDAVPVLAVLAGDPDVEVKARIEVVAGPSPKPARRRQVQLRAPRVSA